MSGHAADLERIAQALAAAAEVLVRHAAGARAFELKRGHGPVTAADLEADQVLRELLVRPGEGWLSEESEDQPERLQCSRTWVVDPIDGTRAFVAGRPGYAVSVALCVDGVPVLGGVCNPAVGVTVLGGPGAGITVRGALPAPFPAGPGLRVLCSRSEWKRGEWERWQERGLRLQPLDSVAWKLALVAAGVADATWTFQPKSEWDVAGGAALVAGAGGRVWVPGQGAPAFNRPRPRLPGFAAAAVGHAEAVAGLLAGTG
jgi:myo-inositol-1(or 4)-monophosphatase